jgi:8-oxo-dGTP pyrophosphatase MutT (NUDIX family)
MKQAYLKEVQKLREFSHVDKKIIGRFITRIASTDNLTIENNSLVHFCSFFVPVDKKWKGIYIGHHIKADDWIPPGGHIKIGESPQQTALREFGEELNYKVNKESIHLFDLSIIPVRKTGSRKCKIHYDFWYLVYVESIDFKFDKNEFHAADWFTFEEALQKTKSPIYNAIMRKIKAFV